MPTCYCISQVHIAVKQNSLNFLWTKPGKGGSQMNSQQITHRLMLDMEPRFADGMIQSIEKRLKIASCKLDSAHQSESVPDTPPEPNLTGTQFNQVS